MALCRCEFCGKPFNSVGTKLCADCVQELDNAYVKARKYIYQNPNEASLASIAEHTGVSEEAISYLIDQGRILVKSEGVGKTRCRACGVETNNGMLCERCRKKLISEKLISDLSQVEKCPEHTGLKARPLRKQDL